jgi:hypothetical protein
MEIQDTRRKRLALLIEQKFDGSQAKFVEHTGENQGEVSGLLRSKSFGERKARKIEAKCDLPKFWLDEDFDPASKVMAMPPRIHQDQNTRANRAVALAPGEKIVEPEWMALIHVTQRELDLLTHYRSASEIGRSLVETAAESAARESTTGSAHQS